MHCICSVHVPLRVLHADGGMAKNAWFLQYLASTCNITVKRPSEVEATAFGAAILAAVGCGYLESLSDVASYWSCGEVYSPDKQRDVYDGAYQGWVDLIASVKKGMESSP